MRYLIFLILIIGCSVEPFEPPCEDLLKIVDIEYKDDCSGKGIYNVTWEYQTNLDFAYAYQINGIWTCHTSEWLSFNNYCRRDSFHQIVSDVCDRYLDDGDNIFSVYMFRKQWKGVRIQSVDTLITCK